MTGSGTLANLPASASGGGARNLGRSGSGGDAGGDGDRGSAADVSAFVDLRGAGGGGGPFFLAEPAVGGGGGGGGGGARPPLPLVRGAGGGGGAAGDDVLSPPPFIFCCSSRKKSIINSWFSLIKSSVKPLSLRSLPKCSRHSGSKASSSANSDGGNPKLPFRSVEDECCGPGGGGGRLLVRTGSGVGAEEWRWKRPPSRLCFCLAWPPPPNSVSLVARLAFFSRSSIFFLNCFASFSSTKLRPARQSSSSKVWKKTRSWL